MAMRPFVLLFHACSFFLYVYGAPTSDLSPYRKELTELHGKKDMIGLENLCKALIIRHEENLDGKPPNVYEYMGVAQYSLGRLDDAIVSFEKAIVLNPNHGEAYMHLGDTFLSKFRVLEAIRIFEIVLLEKRLKGDLSALYKARNWAANWTHREALQDEVHAMVLEKLNNGERPIVSAADLPELHSRDLVRLSKMSAYSMSPHLMLCCLNGVSKPKQLKIGFVSSDFGVHPVATLVRGLMSMLSLSNDVEVLGFALTDSTSWWRENITSEIKHMVSLNGMSTLKAAQTIQQHEVDVLVDLNGYTLHSGLAIFSLRPAPVQISFLGYPLTTGCSYIDFFLVDPISAPPTDIHNAFTEKIIYLPLNYIVNDYKQIVPHVLVAEKPTRSQAGIGMIPRNSFVFASFSNWQKMDPLIFKTWMNILHRVPNSVLWFMKYKVYATARKNLAAEAKRYGIDASKRIIYTKLTPWINHTWIKQAADLVLDTSLKNGHTTVIDALWAGVPIVTIQGEKMSNRAASSAVASISKRFHYIMSTNSFKEYEDLAVRLAKNQQKLKNLRQELQEARINSSLFDTEYYTAMFKNAMKAAWENKFENWKRLKDSSPQANTMSASVSHASSYHIVISPRQGNAAVDDVRQGKLSRNEPAHLTMNDEAPLLLHIGGQTQREGWSIVNIQSSPHVDYVMEMKSLNRFQDGSVTAIYSSHTLEHCGYGTDTEEVNETLSEWFRVLKPGGVLFISVPDLNVLASLFIDKTLTRQERFHVMRMIYGGQIDQYDYHKVGFDQDILESFLQHAGFCSIRRIDQFNLFNDTSTLRFKSRYISLNMMAKACKPGEQVSVELPV